MRSILARVCCARGGALAFAFRLEGDLGRLRIPGPAAPRRAHGLWRHTCFEAFVAPPGSPGYLELNFSPSGEWTAYAFRGYRDGASDALETAPQIDVRIVADRLELQARVDLNRLPALRGHDEIRLALCAVIEEEPGLLSYWALAHSAAKPDFHHPDAFALTLELPGAHAAERPTDEEAR